MGAYPELNVMRGTANTHMLSWSEILRSYDNAACRVQVHTYLGSLRTKLTR